MLNDGRSNPAPTLLGHGHIQPLAPIEQNFCSAILGSLDVAQYLLVTGSINYGSHLSWSSTWLNLAGLLHHLLEQLVLLRSFSGKEQNRRRHTTLTGASGIGHNNVRGGTIDLTIWQGNQMILSATKSCDTLVQITAPIGNNVGHWRASDKRHGPE